MSKIYLAIPYTFNPQRSFEAANKITAKLMLEGHVVFSPISHSHSVAEHLPEDLLFDHDFWMRMDLPLLEWADEVHVVILGEMGAELVENSRGVKAELARARELNKPVKIITWEF